nr:hypothetical protein [Acholeplasmatales bacterium]
MKKITDMITVSELSRLIDISRPTLYKYINEYEIGAKPSYDLKFKHLFDYITEESTISKNQVYDYCMAVFESKSNKAILDKIKILLEDYEYKDLFKIITNNI